jgi:7-keto-8-aminopelargonate synthetase-like enzyme
VVVEGISTNWGDICPLKKVHALCDEFKYRIILDDSNAIGVLGKTGR